MKPIGSYDLPVSFAINYDKTCSGITLSTSAGTPTTFNTASDLMAGSANQEYLGVQYNPGRPTARAGHSRLGH